ncbi:MAG: Holliday junction resolvase-like protein [Candidatus Pacearchaeota archaeon]
MTNKKLLSQKKSSEIVTGHITEKLAPLTAEFKYDPRDAIFLGMPIDYLIFTDNEVVFLEIKSGNSKLTGKQRVIKKLIEEKKVKWDTIRITGPTEQKNVNSDLTLEPKLLEPIPPQSV